MINPTNIADYLKQHSRIPLLDARSPGEFAAGHIPGAISMPLFSDEERKQVGICYKEKGKDAAVLLGLEFVGPKMAGFVKEGLQIAPDRKIALHCWRGGMRSGSLAWLFNTAGFEVTLIKGGYKAYRNYVLESFEKDLPIVILGGMTGSGKTEILQEINKTGVQIIDLEALAHHKGSSFGALGQAAQPSTEQFENNLSQQWTKLDSSKTLFLEDESSTIGTVRIPHNLWQKIRNSPVIKIEVPKEIRIQRLVKEYGAFDQQHIAAAIERIRKRLGGQHANAAIEALRKNDLAIVADIALTYYDKAYNTGLSHRDNKKVFSLVCEEDNAALTAQKIIEFAKEINLLR